MTIFCYATLITAQNGLHCSLRTTPLLTDNLLPCW